MAVEVVEFLEIVYIKNDEGPLAAFFQVNDGFGEQPAHSAGVVDMGETIYLGVNGQTLLAVGFLGDVCQHAQYVVYFLMLGVVNAVGDPVGAGGTVSAVKLEPLLVGFRGDGLEQGAVVAPRGGVFLAGFGKVRNFLRQAQQLGAGRGKVHGVLPHVKHIKAQFRECQELVHALLQLAFPLQNLAEMPDDQSQGGEPEQAYEQNQEWHMEFCSCHTCTFLPARFLQNPFQDVLFVIGFNSPA